MRRSGSPSLGRVLAGSAGAVLRNGRLARVVGTWGLWAAGEWTFLVLLSVTAYDRGGTTAIAIVGAVRMIPGAVASPLVSVAADRISRARVLNWVLLSWTVLVASVPVALLSRSTVPLYLVVGVASVTATLLRPAVNALIPQVVDTPAELAAGNSAYSTLEALGSLVGPLIGGLLVAATSSSTRYLVTAVLFASGTVLSVTIRTQFKPADHVRDTGWRRAVETLAGFPALVRPPRLRSVFLVIMAQTTTRGLLNVLVVAAAVSLLHTGLSSTGWLFGAIGAGGLVGAVVTMLGTRWRAAPPFVLGMAMWGVPLLVIAAWPQPSVVWLALAVLGFGNALGDVFGFTLFHRLVPDHLLGRTFGAFWGSASATQALGALLAAPLISAVGLRASFVVVGIAMTAVPLASWFSVRRIDAELLVDDHLLGVLHDCVLLAPLTRVALEQLARTAEQLDVPPGTTVVRQGEVSSTFYVIDHGALDAEVDGTLVRQMADGDCFGEIAALNRTPRTATVIARQPCHLVSLRGTDFVLAVTGQRPAEAAAADLVRERIGRTRRTA